MLHLPADMNMSVQTQGVPNKTLEVSFSLCMFSLIIIQIKVRDIIKNVIFLVTISC